jgi:uncharacterized protein (TIGR02145 family)
MQSFFRSLILGAAAYLSIVDPLIGQVVICPGELVVFEVADDYYGTKTWEYSTDRVTWTTVEVTENTPIILQPEQAGWYRVRFHDADCDTSYLSEPTRFAVPSIDLGPIMTVSIGGRVTYESGMAAQGATVRAGCGAGISTTTDNFGVFLLDGVAVQEGLAHVTVEKEGYFTASRSFVPGENAEDAISHTYITLLQKNIAGTVNGIAGGTVTLEGMSITFPSGAFTQNGAPYTGEVAVSVNHIDPTSEDLHTQMPGMLMGVINDEPQLLLSYGMGGVELSSALGQEVQLAPGILATVRFPVMADQLADAPASIPLWWFDEDLGYWIREGEAVLVGNEYVGEVAHFTWWNCDVPGNFVGLTGVVFENATGAILAGARIVAATQTMGSGITYTDTQGEFSGQVPVGQELTISVQLPCGANGSWITVHEEVAGPYEEPSVISVSVTIPDAKLVLGTVVDCDGLPVDAGYVLVNGAPHFCVDALFEVFTCEESITLQGFDITTGNVSDYSTIQLENDTTDVGALVTCTPLFGTVTDIEGNTYQTVIIGDQEWMAENLRTASYANNDPIPNVTLSSSWVELSTGAWSNYDNVAGNDLIYGKLYNWYAAADPRRVCPEGWHVPSDAEWTVLTDYLGGGLVAGGKMKAVSPLWWTPNVSANNESGFSGLPGGSRWGNGNFNYLSLGAYWWSSSESPFAESTYMRALTVEGAGVERSWDNNRAGFALRCVRD